MLHAFDALKEVIQGVSIGDVRRKGIREIHTAGVQVCQNDGVRDFVIGAQSAFWLTSILVEELRAVLDLQRNVDRHGVEPHPFLLQKQAREKIDTACIGLSIL